MKETEQYLRQKRVTIDRYQILQLFMVTGGVPQYLKDVKPSDSAITAIDRLAFTKDGVLRDEFNHLYPALFNSSERHIAIVRALAQKPSGLSRSEIIKTCKMSSGGGLTTILDELIESGFVIQYIPFKKNSKYSIYKLGDEYSLFYLKFIEGKKLSKNGTWEMLSASPSWAAWSGLAFENICQKHINQIKKGLGIEHIYSEESIWRHVSTSTEKGAQIDLLIDRNDNSINLVEIKFSKNTFIIDKKYAEELAQKRAIFAEQSRTKKTLFMTLISVNGVKRNEHFLNQIQSEIKADVLFD